MLEQAETSHVSPASGGCFSRCLAAFEREFEGDGALAMLGHLFF